MAPWDALPENIDEPKEWEGKDDDKQWYTHWRQAVKGWFAYGYRTRHWWARWRKYPVPLLCFGDNSLWRYECPGKEDWYSTYWDMGVSSAGYYLSRIQYQKRWNLIFQWPFFLAVHVYFRKDAMPKDGKRKCREGLENQMNFYVGSLFDNDLVYWFPAIAFGGTWK